MVKAIKMHLKKSGLKKKIISLTNQVKGHELRYMECAICGEQRQASKIAVRGAFAGQVVSGKLWYCPKCDHTICIPCSKSVGDNRGISGVKCPRCGGSYNQFPYNKDIEEKKKQIVSLTSELYDIEHNA